MSGAMDSRERLARLIFWRCYETWKDGWTLAWAWDAAGCRAAREDAIADADAELARVCEWLRDMPIAQLGPLIGLSDLSDFTGGSDEAEFRTFLRGIARLAEARAHWPRKDEQ